MKELLQEVKGWFTHMNKLESPEEMVSELNRNAQSLSKVVQHIFVGTALLKTLLLPLCFTNNLHYFVHMTKHLLLLFRSDGTVLCRHIIDSDD